MVGIIGYFNIYSSSNIKISLLPDEENFEKEFLQICAKKKFGKKSLQDFFMEQGGVNDFPQKVVLKNNIEHTKRVCTYNMKDVKKSINLKYYSIQMRKNVISLPI